MPCPNSPHVTDALREFAAGLRPRVPALLVSGREVEAPCTIVIEEREAERGGRGRTAPEERHIAFATNDPGIDASAVYPRRWGIEAGFNMVKSARIRTSSRDEGVRTLCLVLSLAAHNAWAVACAEAQAGSADGWLPRATFRLALVMAAAGSLGPGPGPESPPPVWP